MEAHLADNGSGFPYTSNTTYKNTGFIPKHLDEEETASTPRGFALVFLSLLGALLNVAIMISIIPNRRLHTVTNVLVCHLGVVGLLSSVILVPFYAVASFLGGWIGGPAFCKVHGYLTTTLSVGSLWTIAGLSWDKYQTIASPLHHSTTTTRTKMTICFSVLWGFSTVLALFPLLGGSEYTYQPTKVSCTIHFADAHTRWYTISFISITFCVPVATMSYCYSHIFNIARTQSRRIATLVHVVTLQFQAPITHARPSTAFKGKRAMMTIIQLVGAFVISYIPYCAMVVYEIITGKETYVILVALATTLFQGASCTNAFVYGAKNRILRESFRNYIRRKYQEYSATYHSRSNRRSASLRNLRALAAVKPPDASALKKTRSQPASLGLKTDLMNGELAPLQRSQSADIELHVYRDKAEAQSSVPTSPKKDFSIAQSLIVPDSPEITPHEIC